MDCPSESAISDTEYLRRFNREVIRRRIPLMGSLALTHRCPLACRHCYTRGVAPADDSAPRELSVAQWTRIVEEAADAGCLYLLLTGGDPLVRDDFSVIYRRARQCGMMVSVFTSGLAVTNAILSLFREWPPQAVEVTLYGATDETDERITGVAGARRKAIQAIEQLLAGGIRVRLKTMLMTLNRHEAEAMERIAAGYGSAFRLDACLFPRLNGDRAPLDLRVAAGEAVAIEFADGRRAREWAEFRKRQEEIPATERLYACGAGRTAFHVDPWGDLRPCVTVRRVSRPLPAMDFAKAWKEIGIEMEAKVAPPGFECRRCARRAICGYCPGVFEMETGSEAGISRYFCETGEHREERMGGIPAEARGGAR